MIKCLTCGYEFEEYAQQRTFWDGETVPCCPICGTNLYDGHFKEAIKVKIPTNKRNK